MNTTTSILIGIVVGSILAICIALYTINPKPSRSIENFANISLTDITTAALDSAPSTSEVKKHYKTLLVFADSDIRALGTDALRILGDFRNRVYGIRNFRSDLKADDVFANWPSWIPALDTTIKEPVPTVNEAVNAEVKLLAYIQKNYPQESGVDPAVGSIVRNILDDFGYRFVFDKSKEKVRLRDDFLKQPLTKDWVNPVKAPTKSA